MKKGLTIAFFFICSWASGTTYYVATNGKDSNPGSFSQPWGTWGKAFTSTSVKAGDTIFIRGGVYNITVNNGSGYRVTRAGTADNLIVYSNFPGEIPILDCSNVQTTTQYPVAVQASTSDGANYVKFIGLTVRNHPQYRKDVMTWVKGFGCENGFFTFENCTAYNIEGHGFDSYFYNGYPIVNGAHTFINCDAYVCYNPEVISGYLPGNAGVGFNSQNWYGTEGHAYAINCRAWECGDQGFSWNGEHYCEAVGCWSFNNGKLQGDGHGFKLGWHDREYPAAGRLNVVNKNCIAAYNRASGMTTNDSGEGIATGMNIYNNLIYHNGYSDHPSWRYQYGLYVYNTPDDDSDELLRIFRNNICFDNAYGEVYVASGAYYTHSHNSWDGGATITAADFKALPESQVAGISLLSSPRNQDGSLPDLGDYFQLADNSDAIDAGLNVGIPFAGEAPDLGFLETKVAADTPLIPTLIKAVIENANPSQLVMTYSLPLANTVPANSAFTVRVNSTARSLNAVAISGTTVTLTLASPVNYGDQVTVAYTKPSINPIQTPQGAQAASFAAQTVNNNVAANQPPVVNISSPTKSNSFIAPATIIIEATATDPDGTIKKIEFFSGTKKIGELTIAPFIFSWKNVPHGSYVLKAVATDNKGATSTSDEVIVVVEESTTINQKPVVSIKNNGQSKIIKKNSLVQIEVEAYDPDGSISLVTVKNGDDTLATFSASPYVLKWEARDTGKFYLSTTATDNLGAVSSSNLELIVIPVTDEDIILALYPNPTNGNITIELDDETTDNTSDYYEIILVNTAGVIIYRDRIASTENIININLTDRPPSPYVLMVSSGNKLVGTRKLIKY